MDHTTIGVEQYFHINYLLYFDHFIIDKQGLFRFFNEKIYISSGLFIKIFCYKSGKNMKNVFI
ncbi:hypothetical protein DB299_05230 (plasmid) [Borreliella bavariensis PBi]|uniref:Uncharacterized protein n=1 Tax=Borrelia garinii subsp. bavariensis (strain ATCC BAA-2496 / DSM 23469 / PBi) TaxID=290434 RepID=A0ABN5RFJ4_BORGP|nr:hypothetical protein DB299_05230 [Borreliella bavariensis PBi]